MSKKILVIDDETSVRRSFQLALEDTEYEVDTAGTGEDGVEMAREDRYDLVFLDLKMPGMSGVETLRALRSLDIYSDIPIYIVTAFYQEYFEDLKTASNEGMAFEVLRKPCGSEEILKTVQSNLEGPISV